MRNADHIQIVEPEPWHIRSLAPRLRKIDQLECAAMSGMYPAEVMAMSAGLSVLCRVGLVDGRPEAIWGMTPVSEIWGSFSPWCLTSDWVESNPIHFMRFSREFLQEMRSQASYLQNHVHINNSFSKRWLASVGFTVDPEPKAINGHVWNRFYWENA